MSSCDGVLVKETHLHEFAGHSEGRKIGRRMAYGVQRMRWEYVVSGRGSQLPMDSGISYRLSPIFFCFDVSKGL